MRMPQNFRPETATVMLGGARARSPSFFGLIVWLQNNGMRALRPPKIVRFDYWPVKTFSTLIFAFTFTLRIVFVY